MMRSMSRTTVMLEPDVEALVHRAMRERGVSFKEALNSAIRAGLAPAAPALDLRFPTFDMGEPFVDLSHAAAFVAELEADEIGQDLARGR